MKVKQIILFLISFALCCSMFCVTAYADDGLSAPPFEDIANELGVTWCDNYAIFYNGTYYYYCYNTYDFSKLSITQKDDCINLYDGLLSPHTQVYQIKVSNPYSNWTKVYSSNPYDTDGFDMDNAVFEWASEDLYDRSGDTAVVVFQQTPLNQRGQTNPEAVITPSSQSTLTSVVSTNTLQGVLAELIACLPILIPVLISFIAIRKGLKTVLRMLRTA